MQTLKTCISHISFLRKLLEEALHKNKSTPWKKRNGNMGNPTNREAKSTPGITKGGPKMTRQREHSPDRSTIIQGCPGRSWAKSTLPFFKAKGHMSNGAHWLPCLCTEVSFFSSMTCYLDQLRFLISPSQKCSFLTYPWELEVDYGNFGPRKFWVAYLPDHITVQSRPCSTNGCLSDAPLFHGLVPDLSRKDALSHPGNLNPEIQLNLPYPRNLPAINSFYCS